MSERAPAADPPPPPVSTINDFIPEGRDLSECISSLPRPGCGSEARSDAAQIVLFGVLLAALVFIAWRIVRSGRRARRATPAGPAADE